MADMFAAQHAKRSEAMMNALLEDARQTPALWEWPGFMPILCHLSDVVDDAAWADPGGPGVSL